LGTLLKSAAAVETRVSWFSCR